ncbi:GNAT family N-acetyltransferase [Maribacter polysiphoniae]|uniref:Acetyltransferase (GNAT) family protein n=1 Tax=Maribacter polysiphoniae TaxID=429344 RepID=A0A316DVB9_9FLAO|nr:GNAT family N-acetyltransferase [Maribacter polysiphoniae]MBD1262796.1 GNAT family N-acetyltransferase [Maribacter polysiphoniae]PWK21915.1 acetyltransferase (GNAT) family protein [Maribacter polysiphoniae]
MKIKKYVFAYDFYDTRSIYPFYKNIINKTNGKSYINNETYEFDDLARTLHVVNYINPYYTIIIKRKTSLRALKFKQTNGFMAQLRDFTSIEQYISANMGSKSRTKIRGYLRKLESCFNISYKMHYGKISRKEYDFLFVIFKRFLVRRFNQRGDNHEAFSRWDFIQKTTYKMILDKTASLFVIYNEDQPIDICLNYHHQNVIDNAIRSYDIDYSKFRLGYIDIYKQLEWCFENEVEIFDLSIGDFDYKRKWCNVVYEFENHILYDETNYLKMISAHLLLTFYLLKGYLKDRNVHLFYQKIRNLLKAKEKPGVNPDNGSTDLELLENLPQIENITPIDFLDEKYINLRKPIHDFQYSYSEHSKNLSVYKVNNQDTIFYVKGLNKVMKISIKST